MTIALVPWDPSHAESIVRYADNPKVAANLRNVFPSPYTREDAEAFIRACMEQGEERQLNRAIVVDGEAVGGISVTCQEDVYCRSAEIGYWLAEPFWGRGIMSGAVGELCAAAFDRFPILRIYAEPFAYNRGSRAVLEKNGFQLEGILRQSVWKKDQVFEYALLREDWEKSRRSRILSTP